MKSSLKVVFVAYEAVPFAKVGGLGDVAGALPDALSRAGADVTLLIPRFGDIDPHQHDLRPVALPEDWSVGIDWKQHPFRAWEKVTSDGVRVLLLGDETFYGRPGVYNAPGGDPFGDELERLVFFSKGAVELMKCLDLNPDVVHLNDFHTALIAPYLRDLYEHEECFRRTAIVFSIHNLGYQGVFGADQMQTIGFNPDRHTSGSAFEYHGQINLMKLGIEFSDEVTTVSPTYAREIQGELGAGLEGLLQSRSDHLTGVLNGIDETVWNPKSDQFLCAHYSSDDLEGKQACKSALLETMGLPADALTRPLIGCIGRLVAQKGMDVALKGLDAALDAGAACVLLGSGSPELEDLARSLAARRPADFACRIGFDEALAHQITAGADFFLMPSHYEPCGLNQMYALRYGTIPVVRRTGGLADTVKDWNWDQRSGNGFLFNEVDVNSLGGALSLAIGAYGEPEQISQLRANGMACDWSWGRSAKAYVGLYHRALSSLD